MSIKEQTKRASADSQNSAYQGQYVVPEGTINDFVGGLGIEEIDGAALQFQIVADLTINSLEQRIDELDPAALRRLRQLARQSSNTLNREIMRAIIGAIAHGPPGINAAHLTAAQVVESAFRWTSDYFSALRRYKERLRRLRESVK